MRAESLFSVASGHSSRINIHIRLAEPDFLQPEPAPGSGSHPLPFADLLLMGNHPTMGRALSAAALSPTSLLFLLCLLVLYQGILTTTPIPRRLQLGHGEGHKD